MFGRYVGIIFVLQEDGWAPPWEFAFAIARREAPIRKCLRAACMREGRERKHTP